MNLRLETFLSGPGDFEGRQYLILQGLKEHYSRFSNNRLYPSLSDLVDLYGSLQDLLREEDHLKGNLPQDLKDIDVEHQKLVYESIPLNDSEISQLLDLIEWAIPHIKKALDEGMAIYQFVDSHIIIAHVGILPMYREEGYWFVPDSSAHQLHVLRYEVSLFTSANERYRSLKTRHLESMEQGAITNSPEAIKLMLVEKYHDLPNPATYLCETDLDFPYSETILPVAKRKLMAHLFS
jgi:benzoyl-CoA reductase/2-hydroxyglutaryl-CoA dehydratase subunit BcrC/BadD/HgdB